MTTCHHLFVAILLCCLLMTPAPARAIQATNAPIKVTFLTPSPPEEHPFWDDYTTFMKVAAISLGIDLTVIDSKHRFEVLDNATTTLSASEKPDYLVYIYHAKSTVDTLKMAEKAGVKSIISNTDITPDEKVVVGIPRDKFAHWIGHIFPDDTQASRLLTDRLISRGMELGLTDFKGQLQINGIGGNRETTPSLYREHALRKVVEETPNTVLNRFVWADWSRSKAASKTIKLIEFYPGTKVYWAVHDNTALGVIDGIRKAGLTPGKDVLTGGIDWSAGGIEAVRNGYMEATIGGHFMEGAWALIMILDYHNGHDFAAPSPILQSHMRLIDKTNLAPYLQALDRKNWTQIDFKQFTKTHNPTLMKYDFSPDAVVRALNQ